MAGLSALKGETILSTPDVPARRAVQPSRPLSQGQQLPDRLSISARLPARALLRALALFRRAGWPTDAAAEEPPLRAELFSADQMEQHGRTLATAHVLGDMGASNLLLLRL